MRKRSGAAHVVTIVKRVKEREYRTHLLRRSYRDGDRVRNETLANLSALGDEKVAMIRQALQGKKLVDFDEMVTVTSSLPHGHVAALLGMARKLELERLIDRTPSRKRRLALALVVQRVLSAGSKLASSRYFAHSTLSEELGVVGADDDELYAAMDYLLATRRNRAAPGGSASGRCDACALRSFLVLFRGQHLSSWHARLLAR